MKTYEPIEATTQKITISRQAGDWYLSCRGERPFAPTNEFTPTATNKTTEVVGVDLGIKTLATLSNGEVFKSVLPYKKAQNRQALLQRQLSRKVKHSSNWYKAVVKLAKQHRRVANIRKDALHKLTTYASLEPRHCCHRRFERQRYVRQS
ncbi:MAG: transposase [Okeania sp. SIO2D1]|nr:transposase [Okeania sp. SIO2D1]